MLGALAASPKLCPLTQQAPYNMKVSPQLLEAGKKTAKQHVLRLSMYSGAPGAERSQLQTRQS